MTRQELFAWCMDQYGTEPEYPWKDRNAVLRHKDNKKWYGVILETGKNKLELPGDGTAEILNVKCDPVLAASCPVSYTHLDVYKRQLLYVRILNPSEPLPTETWWPSRRVMRTTKRSRPWWTP